MKRKPRNDDDYLSIFFQGGPKKYADKLRGEVINGGDKLVSLEFKKGTFYTGCLFLI